MIARPFCYCDMLVERNAQLIEALKAEFHAIGGSIVSGDVGDMRSDLPLIHVVVYPSANGERNDLAMYSEGEVLMERDQLDSGANGTPLGLRRRNMKDNANRAVLRIAHRSELDGFGVPKPPNNTGRLGSNIAFQGTGYNSGADEEMGWMGFHWTLDSTQGNQEQGFWMGLFKPVAVTLVYATQMLYSIGSTYFKWKVPADPMHTGLLANGELYWYVEETTNALTVVVKYSNGTVKSGTIPLT